MPPKSTYTTIKMPTMTIARPFCHPRKRRPATKKPLALLARRVAQYVSAKLSAINAKKKKDVRRWPLADVIMASLRRLGGKSDARLMGQWIDRGTRPIGISRSDEKRNAELGEGQHIGEVDYPIDLISDQIRQVGERKKRQTKEREGGKKQAMDECLSTPANFCDEFVGDERAK